MNLEHFERLVNIAAAEHLRGHPFLKAAIMEVAKEKGRIHERFIPEILNLADKWSREYLPPEQPEVGIDLSPTRMDFFTAAILAERLAPWAESLREKGFGKSDPPFEGLGAAAAWIEQTRRREREQRRKSSGGTTPLRKEVHYVGDRVVGERTYRINLRYIKPGKRLVQNVHAAPETFLEKLAIETERMETRTGLSQAVLVAHVLTGLEPLLPRARVTVNGSSSPPAGDQVFSRWVGVQFFAKDLTYNELRTVYSAVREHVGGKGSEGLSAEDERFLELVERLGGPPTEWGTKKRFWLEFVEIWNRDYSGTKYRSWEGAKNKYESLCKRLDASP